MDFTIVVPVDIAEEEVNKLMDIKVIMPKKREALYQAIENLIEAVSFGFVTINDDGSIVQKLVTPVGKMEKIEYASRVEPAVMQGLIKRLPVESASAVQMAYMKAYTGKLENDLNKLEPTDRGYADWITLFFR